MSRKITVGAALALALLLAAVTIPLTMMFAQSQQNKLIRDLPGLLGSHNALDEIKKKIEDEFYDPPAPDAMDAAMVRGYIAGLGDPESRYLSAEEYKTYMERLEGNAPELGIVLKYSPEVVGLVIAQVKAGSSADAAGLKPGDHIAKAESGGIALSITAEIAPDKAAQAIEKFYEETAVTAETSSISVTITYKRDGTYRPPVNMMLGNAASTISYEMKDINDGQGETPVETVGYIKIHQFFLNTADQIEAAVKDLSNRGAVSYILDVRGCYEGNLESVRRAIDLFAYMPQDTAGGLYTVYYRDRPPYIQPPTSKKNIMSYTTGGWVVVLVDGRTSGVAELFAYELRAFNRGKVFLAGEATRGISTVQEYFPLDYVEGAALLTVGRVVPYGVKEEQRWTWNDGGVQPNLVMPETKAGIIYSIQGDAQQLKGALNILRIETEAANNS